MEFCGNRIEKLLWLFNAAWHATPEFSGCISGYVILLTNFVGEEYEQGIWSIWLVCATLSRTLAGKTRWLGFTCKDGAWNYLHLHAWYLSLLISGPWGSLASLSMPPQGLSMWFLLKASPPWPHQGHQASYMAAQNSKGKWSRKQGRNCRAFYNPALGITQHHFRCALWGSARFSPLRFKGNAHKYYTENMLYLKASGPIPRILLELQKYYRSECPQINFLL